MARDYKYWGGIGAAFLTTGLLGVATTWWGVVATSSLPWWPTIVFGLLSLVGVYFLLAGWRGWPVPAEKAERIRKRQDAERSRAGAKRQHEEVERREAAGKRAEAESHRWQAAAFVDNQRAVRLELHSPLSSDGHFEGATATCVVMQGQYTYETLQAVPYDCRRYAGFVVAFPQEFEPRSELVPGEYFVTWRSDVLDELRGNTFAIDQYGRLSQVAGG